MLVCHVSLLARGRSVAADLAEATFAAESLGTGNIAFDALIDDPASVDEIIDAYLGLVITEVVSADDVIDALASGAGIVTVSETATAADVPDAGIAIVLATFDGVPSNATLSNGNRTATHANTTSDAGARSASNKSSGKFYWEITVGASSGFQDAIGIMASGATYAQVTVGTVGNHAAVYKGSSGIIWSNNASTGKTLGTTTAGDIVGIALDIGANRIWFRKNGGAWQGDGSGDPVAGTGGFTIQSGQSWAPMVTFAGSGTAAGDNLTINAGQAAYSMTAPSGFGNWTA